MAGRRLMPPPPGGDGGYEFEVVRLGPPTYLTPLPTVTARGGLIPAGDGEGLGDRPAPPHVAAAPAGRDFGDAALNFEAHFQLGLTRHAAGDHAAAGGLLEQAVAIARRAGDRPRTAAALQSLSAVLRDLGRHESALESTAEVVGLVEETGDRRGLARALVDYGSLLRQLGRFEEAAAALERAVTTVGEF